ncbi:MULTISPECIES: GNAT family N-acetyltransferase [Listeria]|uniref:GNAT family N-acetyltransferase n=1 Tax=Listeria TaxID=1637 RepID=UPI000B591306|nr:MULTISPECIES: GNAT family protein [Listeria]
MFKHQIDEKLTIRVLTKNDVDDYFELIKSAKSYLRNWLTVSDKAETKSDTARNIAYQMNVNEEVPTLFMMEYEGKLVGSISFHTMDKVNQSGEIGYWLAEPFQGQGLMIKSLRFLIDYGFHTLKLHRIEMKIASNNEKSQSLPEKLGFRKEGILKEAKFINGRFVDYVVYGLLLEEYEKK